MFMTSRFLCSYLGVFSHNDFKLTGKIIKRFGLHPKTIISIAGKAVSFRSIFPEKTTIQDAVLWYCDFTSVPRSSKLQSGGGELIVIPHVQLLLKPSPFIALILSKRLI